MRTLVLTALLSCATVCAMPAPDCPPETGVVLQILGSGGPIADDGRASSSYLIWRNGKSRVLIDAGGGAFLRFGEAGARFADLEFVGLSHFHTDHSADFPALLKSGNFSSRERDLIVAGPDAGGPFPGLGDWLEALLARDDGAYGYLGGYLDGTGGLARLRSEEVSGSEVTRVLDSDSIVVDAMHVPHGIVPALAFRVTVDGTTFVFSSDQNGSDEAFRNFARGADVLVMHLVIPEDARGVAARLHARPGIIGAIAGDAQPARLVLSHFMARSLADLDANVALVRKAYDGEIVLAEDLACVVPDQAVSTASLASRHATMPPDIERTSR